VQGAPSDGSVDPARVQEVIQKLNDNIQRLGQL
jgi:hypothetical protein